MTVALEFRDVDILFCADQGRKRGAKLERALARLDAGASRAEIAEETGVVLGVAGASLIVEQGKISVLMGLSGSGKSTLLRAANGLNQVTRGHVLVRDGIGSKDIAACTEPVLRHIRRHRVAMVFQQFALLPWRTVRQNVALGLELRGQPKPEIARIVDERLELVGLSQWADRYAGELSGGMQQRVGLARAFATDADILLMDEPFSALDPLIRAKLQDELLMLQEQVQKTILFVSHDLDEAFKLGDEVTLLEGGRIIQSGTPDAIVMKPASPYVVEFLQHMNPLNVMIARDVMRRFDGLREEGGAVLLDEAGAYRWRDGALVLSGAPLATCGVGGVESGAALVGPADMPIRDLIRACASSEHPVLLTEGGAVVGVVRDRDILNALGPSYREGH